MSEEDLFAQMMGKVKPLQQAESRVQPNKPQKKHDILRSLEDKEVQHQHTTIQQQLSVRKEAAYLLRADGVSSKDIKKLSQMNIKYELDLHGLTQAESEAALNDFFNQAISDNIRYLCVVHGKGNHSGGKAVLKDMTFQWLAHGAFSSFILIATLSAASDGGACNILLRKAP
jgi:DNA-nicking Smr family endonuclease